MARKKKTEDVSTPSEPSPIKPPKERAEMFLPVNVGLHLLSQIDKALNRPASPEHAYVVFAFDEDRPYLRCMGTNGTLRIEASRQIGKNSGEGFLALRADKFTQLLNVISKDEMLKLETTADAKVVRVTANRGVWEIPAMDAQEHPLLTKRKAPAGHTIRVDPDNFIVAIEVALKSLPTRSQNSAIDGMLIERNDNGSIYIVATDGRRMYSKPVPATVQEEFPRCSVHAEWCRAVAKMIRAKSDTAIDVLTVWSDASKIRAEHDQDVVEMSLLEGTYPKWQTIAKIEDHTIDFACMKIETAESQSRLVLNLRGVDSVLDDTKSAVNVCISSIEDERARVYLKASTYHGEANVWHDENLACKALKRGNIDCVLASKYFQEALQSVVPPFFVGYKDRVLHVWEDHELPASVLLMSMTDAND